jgi:hypothetical protein
VFLQAVTREATTMEKETGVAGRIAEEDNPRT